MKLRLPAWFGGATPKDVAPPVEAPKPKPEDAAAAVVKSIADRVQYDLAGFGGSDARRLSTAVYPSPIGPINPELAGSIYRSVPVVNRAVQVGANAARQAVLRVMFAPHNDPNKAKEVRRGEPFTMLNFVNENMGIGTFISTIYSWSAITGECFIVLEDSPEEYQKVSKFSLYPLNPYKVKIIPDRERGWEGIVYGDKENKIFVPRNRVLHLKNFNPDSHWHGHSNLNALNYDLQITQFRKKQLANFYKTAAILQGTITSDDEIGTDEIRRLKKEFAEQHSGAANSYRVMVLENGMKYEALDTATTDQHVDEMLRSMDSSQAMVLGVPLPLLRSDAGGTAKLIEYEALMWKQTIVPFLEQVAELFTKRLCIPLSGSLHAYCQFDVHHIDALQLHELDRVRMEVAAISSGAMTPNEVRVARGRDPYVAENAEFGDTPTPLFNAKNAQNQAEQSASPSLSLPGSEGGRRDQSEEGEAQLPDTTGKRSFEIDVPSLPPISLESVLE